MPFGTSVLYKTRVVAEDLAFDHSPAELIVLNAKEKAKAKALTMSDDRVMTEAVEEDVPEVILETQDSSEAAPAADAAEQGEDEDVEEREEVSGILFDEKRTARKLPKYMLRPTPTNKEGFIAENFRLFVKWTLDLIASNTAITSLGMPDTVYVNMPSQYNFVLDTVNQEFAENKVKFLPLTESELPQYVGQRLELFGGLYAKQYNKINNFHANQMDAIKAKSAYKGSIFGEKKSISFDDVVVKIKDAVSGLAKKKPEAADGTPTKDAAVTKRPKKEKDRTPKAEKPPKEK